MLPETIRSRSLSSSSSCVGKGTNWPSMRPRRTAAIGPSKRQRRDAQRGRGAVHRQHVAVVLPVAGHDERLDLHFVVEPSGNSGRIGRSMSRAVRVSLVVGRPSRLRKPPGNLPAAAVRSR